ncbi:MAG: DUF4349 domain-containing protein [Pseudomonadota bacterium]
MIPRALYALGLIATLVLPPAAVASEEVVSASITVKVSQRDEASAAVIAKARAAGGWFSELAGDHVSLRVPAAEVEPLMDFAAAQGVLAERQISRADNSAELSQARARLGTRREMLEQYMAVLSGASAKAVVSVEREVTRLVAEIEGLEGRIRFLEDRVAYGTVTVWFQFRDRSAPVSDGSSSFAWLNTLNLQDLVADFRWLLDRGGTESFLDAPPAGFAPYRGRKVFRAVSPDGVVFRVRTAEHEPEADLAFWQEAMQKRQEEAGYRELSAAGVSAGSLTGTLLELTAPMGTDDYTYLVALFLAGKRLVIVEAAGEVSRFAARREAVIEAIGRVKP